MDVSPTVFEILTQKAINSQWRRQRFVNGGAKGGHRLCKGGRLYVPYKHHYRVIHEVLNVI